MKTVIFFLFFNIAYTFNGQNVIKLKNFYRGEGVVFEDKDVRNTMAFGQTFENFFTLNLNEIVLAEQFLLKNYFNYRYELYKSLESNEIVNPKYKNEKKIKKKFFKYNRQYFGFINIHHDTIIVMNLLNFKKKKKAELQFINWKRQFVFGMGDWFYENMETFYYNKSKNKFEIYY